LCRLDEDADEILVDESVTVFVPIVACALVRRNAERGKAVL